MLAERMSLHNVDCWLINTGWVGGKYGSGKRCPLKYTCAIVDAIHDGSLNALPDEEYDTFDTFGLRIPKRVNNVPDEVLDPRKAWPDQAALQKEIRKLAGMFGRAFQTFEKQVSDDVRNAGPHLG